jgi:magnesium-transporting ATPase (P-type)
LAVSCVGEPRVPDHRPSQLVAVLLQFQKGLSATGRKEAIMRIRKAAADLKAFTRKLVHGALEAFYAVAFIIILSTRIFLEEIAKDRTAQYLLWIYIATLLLRYI